MSTGERAKLLAAEIGAWFNCDIHDAADIMPTICVAMADAAIAEREAHADLLAACKAFSEAMRQAEDVPAVVWEAWDKAKDAIAKAEGSA